MNTCLAPTCEKPVGRAGRKECRMHEARRHRYGSYELPPVTTEPPAGVQVRRVPSWPDYWAGDDGHIYSARKGQRGGGVMRRMAEQPNALTGYLWANLRKPNDPTPYLRPVHVLVTEAWYGPMPRGLCRRHLDGEKTNNVPSNLRYGTYQQNSDDMETHGRKVQGERQHKATVSDEAVERAVQMVRDGSSHRAVAESFGVSASTVSSWVRGDFRTRTADGRYRSLVYTQHGIGEAS